MNPAAVLDVVSVFFAGLLAGMEFVIHYGVRAPAEVLGEQVQLQLRQALVRRLGALVPALFVPTAAAAIAATGLDGAAAGLWLRCAGLVGVPSLSGVRGVGT